MPHISKHDSKQKRKRNNREVGWVNLLVIRNAVGVDNLLEGFSKLCSSDGRWRLYAVLGNLVDLPHRYVGFFLRNLVQLLHDQVYLVLGDPNIPLE